MHHCINRYDIKSVYETGLPPQGIQLLQLFHVYISEVLAQRTYTKALGLIRSVKSSGATRCRYALTLTLLAFPNLNIQQQQPEINVIAASVEF